MIELPVTLLGVGFVAAAVGLVLQTRRRRAALRRLTPLEAELVVLRQQLDALDTETRHLAEVRMPALVDSAARGHRSVTVPGALSPALRGSRIDDYHRSALDQGEEAVAITRERIALAARAAVRDVMDEAQTYLVRCQMTVLDEMNRHPEGTAYHQGLMAFDHPLTRAIHTLQRTRILTGSWPGLQRADCTLREIVESARGRIDAYVRVAYTYEPGTGEVFVEGRVVEPVTMALTELLSNATSYSEGKVSVEVQQTQTGYCVVVDDRGLSMNTYQRDEAAKILSQHTVLDVTNLPDTMHLGFPVIGRLSGEYGFHADVSSTSPYGGVRAVLRIPRNLLGRGPTEAEQAAERAAAVAPLSLSGPRARPAATVSEHLPTQKDGSSLAGSGTLGVSGASGTPDTEQDAASPALPQRRRRKPRQAPDTAVAAPAGDPAADEDPDAFARSFANLMAAIRDNEHTTEGEQPRD